MKKRAQRHEYRENLRFPIRIQLYIDRSLEGNLDACRGDKPLATYIRECLAEYHRPRRASHKANGAGARV